MKYKVEIKEILSRIVEIEAENEQEAIIKVNNAYHDEKIVLSSEDYIDTEIDVLENIDY